MDAPITASENTEQCTTCAAHAAREQSNEEVGMAFLLALLPVVTLCFLGQVGLLS